MECVQNALYPWKLWCVLFFLSLFFHPTLSFPFLCVLVSTSCKRRAGFFLGVMDKSDSSQTTASSATSTLPTTLATDDEQQQLKKDVERRPSPGGGNRLGGRPKLTTIHSSDASRFMTLERLQQNMTLKPPKHHPTTTSSVAGNSNGDGSNNNNGGSGVHNNSNNNNTTQERQLTIETAVFPEQQPIFHHEKKRSQV